MTKLLLLMLMNAILFGGELISLLPYKTNEFSPALKQTFQLSYILSEDASVTWQIYTPDNNLIRTIKANNIKKGKHTLIWDGKDDNGTVIPDEAYNIVLTAKSKTKIQRIDPRFTGGEILKDLHTKIDRTGNINYTLSSPARVLVRAGIESGPMLRMISNWVPKNKGRVRQHWNMTDNDNLIDFSLLQFGISVSAFALPKYAIITTNNKAINYYGYFKKQRFSCNTLSKEKQFMERDGKAVSKHFYMCRIQDRDPRLTFGMPKAATNTKGVPLVKNDVPTYVKVTMNPEDEFVFEKVKYEVSFFVDYSFASEEELGFMPISWNFMPNGLKKGEHILTVNVSSFTGQVGVKSFKFMVQ